MNTNDWSSMLIIVLAIVFLLILLLAFMVKISAFREDLEYVNMEIRRSTGLARKRWKRKRRKLWLSMLFGMPKR